MFVCKSDKRVFQRGFTLIELMIVVAIVGILSAVALPSFLSYLQEGRRAEAQHFAFQQIAILERQYTRTGQYPEQVADVGQPVVVGAFDITDSEFYSFAYTSTASNVLLDQFTITITPIVDSAQAGDRCGVMTVNHQGVKAPNLPADCWDF